MAHSTLTLSTRASANRAGPYVTHSRRRRPTKTRFLLVVLALALVMLAAGGWVVQVFKVPA